MFEIGTTHGNGNAVANLHIPATLSVFVEGTSHSIAEQGEQLAWLVTALQDSETQELVYSKPSIAKRDAGVLEICVESTPAPAGNIQALLGLEQLGWLGNLINPVIAQGFPTFRHLSQQFVTDLEISPMILADGLTTLDKTATVLRLAKEGQGAHLWHATIKTAKWELYCQCNSSARLPDGILRSRHFIGICPGSGGSDSKVSTPVLAAEVQVRDRDMLDGLSAPATAGSSPASSQSCPETSLDSDMLSVPDSPEVRLQDTPAQLSSVLDRVADQLLREYRHGPGRATLAAEEASPHRSPELSPRDTTVDFGTVLVRTRPQGDARGQYAGQFDSAGHGWSQPRSRPNRKRTACGRDESNDGGQGNMPPQKRQHRGNDDPFTKPLACPYWKLDPVRHRDCVKRDKFWEIKHVKQHLTRKHLEPDIHCGRCKTVFAKEDERQVHLREASAACVFKPWDPSNHLITPSQQKQLQKKSMDCSVPKRWFAVWKIIFPNHPPPGSPYIEAELAADLRGFREYARVRGRVVLLEQLRAAGVLEPSVSPSEEEIESRVLTAVDRALESAIEDFLASLPASENTSRPSRRSRSETSGQQTTTGPPTDSGVSVRAGSFALPSIQEGASSARSAMLGPQPGFGRGQAQLLHSTFGPSNSSNQPLGFASFNTSVLDIQNGAGIPGGKVNTNDGIWPSFSDIVGTHDVPPMMEDSFNATGTILANLDMAGNGVADQGHPFRLEDFGNNNQFVVPGFDNNHTSSSNPSAVTEVTDGGGGMFQWEDGNDLYDWDLLGVPDPNIPSLNLNPPVLDSPLVD